MKLRTESILQYEKNYNYLVREAGSNAIKDIIEYILKKGCSIPTKINYYNTILSLKRLEPEKFEGTVDDLKVLVEERNKLVKILKEQRGKDCLTTRQRNILEKISLEDVKGAHAKLNEEKHKSIYNLENYILLSLMMPPLRNDLMDIKIAKRKGELKTGNSIWLPKKKDSEGVLQINEHKASDREGNGPITKKLDVELTNDIKDFLKKVSFVKERVFLFEDQKGNHYSSSAFSHRLQRLFKRILGVPFSSSVLRKIFWSAEKDKIDELTQQAKGMGHSLNTAIHCYAGKICGDWKPEWEE